jgi:hypothetical protein
LKSLPLLTPPAGIISMSINMIAQHTVLATGFSSSAFPWGFGTAGGFSRCVFPGVMLNDLGIALPPKGLGEG